MSSANEETTQTEKKQPEDDQEHVFQGLSYYEIDSKFEEALRYLNLYRSSVQILYESNESLNNLAFTCSVIQSGYTVNFLELIETYELVDVMIKIMSDLLVHDIETIDENFRSTPKAYYKYKDSVELTHNERKIHALCYVLKNFNSVLPLSSEIRSDLNEKKNLKIVLDLVKRENLCEILFSKCPSYFSNLVFTLNWISKNCDNYKVYWHRFNAIDLFLKYAKKFPKYYIYFYMMSSNVAFDKDIETYSDMIKALDKFIEMTIQSVEEYGKAGFSTQQFMNDDSNEKKILTYEVGCILDEENNATISTTGLLLTLYRFSVNSKLRKEIFSKQKLRECLKDLLINKGIVIEKQYVLRVYAQLSFDEEINKELSQDKELIDYLDKVNNNPNLELKQLKKSAEQLSWILKDANKTKTHLAKIRANQLMISYNTASRDLCLKIKQSLEDEKFKVWIDVDEIHGSSLDSMAKAVESSDIILMCVTEKYRQSVNCQAEAQYAFRLNKKIVPLIMQKGYSNVDGWLGKQREYFCYDIRTICHHFF
jgi:hypothetical protein